MAAIKKQRTLSSSLLFDKRFVSVTTISETIDVPQMLTKATTILPRNVNG